MQGDSFQASHRIETIFSSFEALLPHLPLSAASLILSSQSQQLLHHSSCCASTSTHPQRAVLANDRSRAEQLALLVASLLSSPRSISLPLTPLHPPSCFVRAVVVEVDRVAVEAEMQQAAVEKPRPPPRRCSPPLRLSLLQLRLPRPSHMPHRLERRREEQQQSQHLIVQHRSSRR